MNRHTRIFVALGLLLMFALSTATPTVVAKGGGGGPGPHWVIMYYMCADDSDDDMEQSLLHDIEELESVPHGPAVRSIVMVDRYTNWGTSPGDQNHNTRIYEVFEDRRSLKVDCGELNMGDPSSLSYFIDWTINRYGGVKFALILGGHGRAWEGCCPDYHSVDDLSMSELRTALLDAQSMSGETLDIIGFNACIMQYTEVTYALRDCAEIVVASEEDIWGCVYYGDYNGGWPFDMIHERLSLDIFATPEEFATIMVEAYRDFWISHPIVYPPPGGYDVEPTISAWDVLQNKNMVDAALNKLGYGLMVYLSDPDKRAAIENARAQTEQFPGGTENGKYVDLRHFVDLIDADPAFYYRNRYLNTGILEVQFYTENCMIAEWHDTYGENSHPNANGIGIYFPDLGSAYIPSNYADLDFSQEAPFWYQFLNTYLGF